METGGKNKVGDNIAAPPLVIKTVVVAGHTYKMTRAYEDQLAIDNIDTAQISVEEEQDRKRTVFAHTDDLFKTPQVRNLLRDAMGIQEWEDPADPVHPIHMIVGEADARTMVRKIVEEYELHATEEYRDSEEIVTGH